MRPPPAQLMKDLEASPRSWRYLRHTSILQTWGWRLETTPPHSTTRPQIKEKLLELVDRDFAQAGGVLAAGYERYGLGENRK